MANTYTAKELDSMEKKRDQLKKDNRRLNYKIMACQKDPFFLEEDDEFFEKYNTPNYIKACKNCIANNEKMIAYYDKILEENEPK